MLSRKLVSNKQLSLQVLCCFVLTFLMFGTDQKKAAASLIMKRLYEDLFTDYNKLILPVTSNKTKVTVNLGLKLGQILDLNLKQQILSTNVWVEQTWQDQRLEWNPELYNGINMIHVPAENIWIPDIVLFNNADGNYELTLVAKAVLYANGTVVWKPPTMFRSTCEIDVEYFPFDIQTCFLRFGSWTYAGDEIEIKHVENKRKVDIGIDLSQFYKNVEWDIIDVPAYYNEVYYECCTEPFPDIIFKIVIRRKMLFYLVNLILPVALMTFMTVSVFYLPADSNEKVTLSISILTSLIVFFLLMLEIIPPTSLAVPLFGKYLLFTLVLVSLSACVSVYVLNIYHRSPSVHKMSPRVRQVFLKTLPRLLRLDHPDPRERGSLNRFRKKKIAQQMLQARQNNKVYDLAQPLASSLSLIETLHKSYEFNPNDDSCRRIKRPPNELDGNDDEEEGRYFRRYVDDYIYRMKGADQLEQPDNRKQCNCNGESTTSRRQNKAAARGCCEHGAKCCELANKPLVPNRNYSSRQLRVQSSLNQQTIDLSAVSGGGNLMGPLLLGGSLENDSTTGAQNCPSCLGRTASSSTATAAMQMPCAPTGGRFRPPAAGGCILNDDTFDMTFDYDDQENTGQNLEQQAAGAFLARVSPSSLSAAKQVVVDSDPEMLPSPPPPPRQLVQLSDSMKDLSGRLSSCSQQLLAPRLIDGSGGRDAFADDHQVRAAAAATSDNGQLVDKLISSINMMNASDDIDSTTTSATNNSNEPTGQQLHDLINSQSRARHESVSPNLIWRNGFDGRQKHEQSACICKSPANLKQGQFAQHQQHNLTTNGSTRTLVQDELAGTNLHNQPERPSDLLLSLRLPYNQMPPHVRAAIRSILFIADTIKNEDDENSAIEDWESMSMVVDRLFLWIFFLLCTFGSIIILALAPSLYDHRDSIDDKLRIEIPPSNCSALLQRAHN